MSVNAKRNGTLVGGLLIMLSASAGGLQSNEVVLHPEDKLWV